MLIAPIIATGERCDGANARAVVRNQQRYGALDELNLLLQPVPGELIRVHHRDCACAIIFCWWDQIRYGIGKVSTQGARLDTVRTSDEQARSRVLSTFLEERAAGHAPPFVILRTSPATYAGNRHVINCAACGPELHKPPHRPLRRITMLVAGLIAW
jgi:hypothetical protein